MNFNHISYDEFKHSQHINEFYSKQEIVQELIGLPYNIENFQKQINLKQNSFDLNKRKILSEVLFENYKQVKLSARLQQNLSQLNKSNTFTITTGHQLNLFAGPAYFFYKILHVITMCNELKINYPNCNFVPVFWMASEDHDIEEIRKVFVFGKELIWKTKQEGCVGNFDCKGLSELLDEFKEFYKNNPSSDIVETLNSYEGNTLSKATFNLLNYLFGDKGLIILDANNKNLKKLCKPLFLKEINEMFIQKNVNKTNEILKSNNIKNQAFVREINLFFIGQNNKRERIKIKKNDFVIGDAIFTKNQLIEMIDSSPESFSPNVLFRPLYQELILPNLCYVGGGSELKYWMQLKNTFLSAKIPFPILSQRKTLFYLNKSIFSKIQSLKIPIVDLFKNQSEIFKQSLNLSKQQLNWNKTDNCFEGFLKEVYTNTDHFSKSDITSLNADLRKITKVKESIIKKVDKINNRRFDQIKTDINKIHSCFFPDGTYQERKLHFFHFCPDGNLELMDKLYSEFEPFNNSVLIVSE